MIKKRTYHLIILSFATLSAALLWLSISVIEQPKRDLEMPADLQTSAAPASPTHELVPSSSPTTFAPTIGGAVPTVKPSITSVSATPTPASARATATVMTVAPTAVLQTAIPLARFERQIIGYSVQQRPIELVRLGLGSRWFLLLGALHGGSECHTSDVVAGILGHFMLIPEDFPADVTLYAVPLINQDGCATNTRNNANGVDLNRNWGTPDWQTDAEAASGIIFGAGGPHPFSEPETQLMRDLLIALRNAAPQNKLVVISYHSAVPQTGLVQPGYIGPNQPGFVSSQLAQQYSRTTGYLYSTNWVGNYNITGELIYWANLQDIVALDVELPDRGAADSIPAGWTATHIETNLRGIMALLHDQEKGNDTE